MKRNRDVDLCWVDLECRRRFHGIEANLDTVQNRPHRHITPGDGRLTIEVVRINDDGAGTPKGPPAFRKACSEVEAFEGRFDHPLDGFEYRGAAKRRAAAVRADKWGDTSFEEGPRGEWPIFAEGFTAPGFAPADRLKRHPSVAHPRDDGEIDQPDERDPVVVDRVRTRRVLSAQPVARAVTPGACEAADLGKRVAPARQRIMVGIVP